MDSDSQTVAVAAQRASLHASELAALEHDLAAIDAEKEAALAGLKGDVVRKLTAGGSDGATGGDAEGDTDVDALLRDFNTSVDSVYTAHAAGSWRVLCMVGSFSSPPFPLPLFCLFY